MPKLLGENGLFVLVFEKNFLAKVGPRRLQKCLNSLIGIGAGKWCWDRTSFGLIHDLTGGINPRNLIPGSKEVS